MKFWESQGMASRGASRRFRIPRRPLAGAAAALAAAAAAVFCTGLFTVTTVRFHGCASVPEDSLEIVRIGLIGRNLATLRTGWARERLASFREVESVRFARRPFHTIECRLVKREPVALLAAGSLMEVDREGVVLPPRAGRGDIDLPVITGIGERSLGREAGRRNLARALEVLRLIRAEGFSPAKQVSEIHVDGDDIDLVWTGSGTLIRLGRDEHASRVRKLKAVNTVLLDREGHPEIIDLRFNRQVIIR
jgi:cell division septal protein FtsQ